MSANIKDTDKGFARIKREVERMASKHPGVRVGLVGAKAEESHEGSPFTNAQIAAVHEFGSPQMGIPQRSFLGASFDKNRETYVKLLTASVKAMFEGKMTSERALGLVGAKAAADVKSFVTQGPEIPPPNAPATLARKQALTRKGSTGSVRTLVDTGRMIDAVSWIVEDA